MKKQFLLGIIISASAAGLWVLTTGRDAIKPVETEQSTFVVVGEAASKTAVPDVLNEKTPDAPAVAAPTRVSQAVLPVPYETELKEYANIKNKVFLTEEEKATRRAMLNNDGMLRSLGDYLKNPTSVDQESDQARNLATDLLLEALRTEDSPAAQAALQELIQDTAVEDSKIEQNTRQVLAGTKAEVLYHWSALDPQKSTQMARWLPGPVSQKIWQNVINAQNQNRAESALEKPPSL